MNIHLNNYEEFLVDYLHGELHGALKAEMEQFMADHPSVYEEYELLQDTILVADESIVFENKTSLLKSEKKAGFWVTYKRELAIAAAISGLVIILSIFDKEKQANDIVKQHHNTIEQVIQSFKDTAAIQPQTQKLAIDNPAIRIKKQLVVQGKNQVRSKELETQHDHILTQKPFRLQEPQIIVKSENTLLIDTISKTNLSVVEATAIQNNSTQNNNSIPPKTFEEPRLLLSVNQTNQPRLIKAINRLIGLKNKVKKSTDQIRNTEVIVMVGNTKIISLNHY